MFASTIIEAVKAVTKKWAKQRKTEERQTAALNRRRDALVRTSHVSQKEAAGEVMEDAYLAASTNNTLPAMGRQIMYRARGHIQTRTGRNLDDKYFTKTLLPEYMIANPLKCQNWDVVWDDRGHFAEPHTGKIVGLGTIGVREYLATVRDGTCDDLSVSLSSAFPTKGPQNRFSAVLFIEKEGFLSLFEAVKLAERYDLAIMTSKGLSTTAARMLVDELCGKYGIPLLVLHDFDKNGLSILATLERNTWRYQFKNDFKVIDLGLRMDDVTNQNLQSESVSYGKSDPTRNLRENGATDAEIAFLCSHRGWHFGGQRVELNAFTSEALVAWIESKLQMLGIGKLVPDSATLQRAFRRAATIATINRALPDFVAKARHEADQFGVPTDIVNKVQEMLRANPALPWDEAIAELAEVDKRS